MNDETEHLNEIEDSTRRARRALAAHRAEYVGDAWATKVDDKGQPMLIPRRAT